MFKLLSRGRLYKTKEIIAEKYDFSIDNVALGHGIVGLLETLSKMFIEENDE